MHQAELDLAVGRALRDAGIDQVTGNNAEFLRIMRTTAESVAKARGTVSINDLRYFAAEFEIQPLHHNAWGAVFHEKRWKRVGFTQAATRESHARTIGVWALA